MEDHQTAWSIGDNAGDVFGAWEAQMSWRERHGEQQQRSDLGCFTPDIGTTHSMIGAFGAERSHQYLFALSVSSIRARLSVPDIDIRSPAQSLQTQGCTALSCLTRLAAVSASPAELAGLAAGSTSEPMVAKSGPGRPVRACRPRRGPPEVRPAALATHPPDLPPRALMALDFAIICPLVRPGRPRVGFLSIGSRLCSTLPSDPAS